MSDKSPPPTNTLVSPLLTDLYQITMAYAYWKNDCHNDPAVFELFYRKNPFGGEYTIFCGLDETLKHLQNFSFSSAELDYLRQCPSLIHCDAAFFDDYLANLDCSQVKLYTMRQGCIAFPRIPLMTIEAPLGIGQLLETTLLNLVNYPTLVATNAARMVVAARGPPTKAKETKIRMMEFGLRRAQGPDGGFSASKYSIVGGFDGTSNVQAGLKLGVPIVGTHAHAFVQTFLSLDQVAEVRLRGKGDDGGEEVRLLPLVLEYRKRLDEMDDGGWSATNDGELAAFIAYAGSFPNTLLCLIDTYDTLKSGLRNFCLVALVLDDLGYTPRGVRLDSGDLAYFSIECAAQFKTLGDTMKTPTKDRSFFFGLDIVASNDINESALLSLSNDGHAITVFGVGTNLVTCQAQPALGCVYKLVQLNGTPRMKLSHDIEKVLIPGRKIPYRLYGKQGWPLLDLMVGVDEEPPVEGESMLCRHPFIEQKRVSVVATKVMELHVLAFDGERGIVFPVPNIFESRQLAKDEIKNMRPDILRAIDPGQYKVSVTDKVRRYLHQLWESEAPVVELC